jgi:hypothetical protein
MHFAIGLAIVESVPLWHKWTDLMWRGPMEFAEIAKALNISEGRARGLVAAALRKIERDGNTQTFASVVRLTAMQKARHAYIRCGSIECRPEKWVFFA